MKNNRTYWDRFDICEAYWCFAMDWHGGQWSPEYAIFGRLRRMQFKPAIDLNYRRLTDNGKSIYSQLRGALLRKVASK
jgi:hypothetical protein